MFFINSLIVPAPLTKPQHSFSYIYIRLSFTNIHLGHAQEIFGTEASLEEDPKIRQKSETIKGDRSFQRRSEPKEETRKFGIATVKSGRVEFQTEGATFEQQSAVGRGSTAKIENGGRVTKSVASIERSEGQGCHVRLRFIDSLQRESRAKGFEVHFREIGVVLDRGTEERGSCFKCGAIVVVAVGASDGG